jgi:hypothetical protein
MMVFSLFLCMNGCEPGPPDEPITETQPDDKTPNPDPQNPSNPASPDTPQPDPQNNPDPTPAPETPQTPSLGSLTVTITNNARTVLPYPVQFTQFLVTFSPQEGQSSVPSQEVEASKGSLTVELEVGSWKIEAVGYEGETPLTRGEKTVTVAAGDNNPVKIAVVIPLEGYGIFEYQISGLSGASEGRLSLSKLGTGSPSEFRVDLLTAGAQDTILANTGFYEMYVIATKGAHSIARFEAVHIYPDKNSLYKLGFPEEDFRVYTLEGTVNILDNLGEPPSGVYLYAYTDQVYENRIAGNKIEGSDWSLVIPQTYNQTQVYFQIELVNHEGTASDLIDAGEMTVDGNKDRIDLKQVQGGFQNIPFRTSTGQGGTGDGLYRYGFMYPLYKSSNPQVTVTLNSSNDTLVRWLLDGTVQSDFGTERTVTINAADYTTGDHTLSAEVTWHDTPQTRDFYFNVED